LTEAARVCADGLSVKFCKVCQYRPDEEDLLIVAGYGWNAELAPTAMITPFLAARGRLTSPSGIAFAGAIGLYYSDFSQTSDDEVIETLARFPSISEAGEKP
jgi:hypothetical protein